VLFFIATAIHVHFPGKSTTKHNAGIIGAQVLLGVGMPAIDPLCDDFHARDTNAIQLPAFSHSLP